MVVLFSDVLSFSWKYNAILDILTLSIIVNFKCRFGVLPLHLLFFHLFPVFSFLLLSVSYIGCGAEKNSIKIEVGRRQKC